MRLLVVRSDQKSSQKNLQENVDFSHAAGIALAWRRAQDLHDNLLCTLQDAEPGVFELRSENELELSISVAMELERRAHGEAPAQNMIHRLEQLLHALL